MDVSDKDCRDVDGVMTAQTIKDAVADQIDNIPAWKGELIETTRSRSQPTFIKTPIEIDRADG